MSPAELLDFVSPEALDRVLDETGFSRRLPGVVFRSPDFLAFEYRQWLSRTWLFVGRACDLPNVGDAQIVLGLALFLVRSGARRIEALHNACRHRGHRLIDGPCKGLKQLVCLYHH